MTLVAPFDSMAAACAWLLLAVWRLFEAGTLNVAHGLGPGWALAWWLATLGCGHVGRWGWVRVRAHRTPRESAPDVVHAVAAVEVRLAHAAAVAGTGGAVGLVAVAVLWEWAVVLVGAVALQRALRHRRRVMIEAT